MNREQKQELRKRGAATRDFTTGDILIESPIKEPTTTVRNESWEKLETNVLLSQTIVQRGFEVEDIRNDAYYNDYGDDGDYGDDVNYESNYNDEVDDDYENSDVNDADFDMSKVARKAMEIVTKPKKKKKSNSSVKKSKTKHQEHLSEIEESVRSEPKETTRPKPKIQKITKPKPKPQKSTTSKLTTTSNTYITPTEVDPTMKITRLPTSSNRLTSIDVLLHYLRSLTPRAETAKSIDHFQLFKDFNEDYFLKVLDLNLTNNGYIYKLKQIKHDKGDLRQRLYHIKNDIAERITELENIRHKYNELKQKIKLQKKLQTDMANLGDVKNNLMGKINKLNSLLDPNFGLLEKLKMVNEKLQSLDKKLH